MEKHPTYKAQKRTDYKAPNFTATNIDITFELADEKTIVKTKTQYKRLTEDKKLPLVLDGEELTLVSVKVDGISAKYKEEGDKLIISDVQDSFEVEIENTINPSANTSLMGLYKSNGTFCTQCEPQGFRRITYFLDRSDVLAKYRVTIIGPEYGCGSLLSNGNLVEKGTIKGKEYAVWEDPFPKPSYLFALVAGTFDVVSDTFVTKSGKKVALELYVDRGCYERGLWAMQSIKDSMKWDETRFDLEFDLDNFKVVAVDFFNFGAMENKGLNVFNSIYVMVDPLSATDTAFYNVQSVIGHEYFHNYTGDRVTLRDWFQLSLKESLTVFRDQEFSSDVASRALTRLHAINVIRGPQFAEDASPMAHPVRPEEVMEMNNFYTVTIYDKGAEIIRMIHTIIGEEKFKKALTHYLKKFDGQAVTIEDFLCAFEESSGADLSQFRLWYTQAGTPNVNAQWTYDDEKSKLIIKLEQHTNPTRDQEVKEPFYMPIRISFQDKDGNDVHPKELDDSGIIIFNKNVQTYEFSVQKDVLPVILRDFSAPIKLNAPYTTDDLQQLLAHCDDAFIKVDSAVRLQNKYIHENIKAYKNDENFTEPSELISAYKSLLENVNKDTDLILLNETLKLQSIANMMETFDKVDIDGLNAARVNLENMLALNLAPLYNELYQNIHAQSNNYSVEDMGRRAISNTALHMLALSYVLSDKSVAASDLIERHYNKSKNMTDKLAAMVDAVHLDLPCQKEILKDFENSWGSDPLVFDNYFRTIATIPNKSAIARVIELTHSKNFDGNNPNRVRALTGALALSNPVALNDISGEGYDLLCSEVERLNSVNPSVAARILTPLLSFKRLDETRQNMIKERLKKLMKHENLSRSIYEKLDSALKD